MRPEDRDLAYLLDRRAAAREISGFVQVILYTGFVENRMVRYAIERYLIGFGEAAHHISEKFQDEHPWIPWRPMVGQRNSLAHVWVDIQIERIRSAATVNIPALLNALEPLVPEG